MPIDMVSLLSIRFLFRFRDLVGNTIIEHQKVIAENKSCWWGWWKRPNEDNRISVWKELSIQASEENPVPVGLFHSGSGRIYIAYVTEVIEPNINRKDGLHPRVPNGEQDLIPSYYRESPYSCAWMRITKIENDCLEFFGKYSYSEAPNLPNYTEEVLKRFNGKVIMEADELRGMDTTIWVVRPREQKDEAKNLFFTFKTIPKPISNDVIRVEEETILHISDLHYTVEDNNKQHVWALEGKGQGRSTMVEAIARAIGPNSNRIGVVLITGDITVSGTDKEYGEALSGINRLLGILGLGTDRVVIVPGNHDILWTQMGNYHCNDELKLANDKATTNYRNFYNELFKQYPNDYLSMGRRFLFPSGLTVEIAALNSSSFETGKNFLAGMGRIQEEAFQDVANALKWGDKNHNIALRILALHHHLTLTENLEFAGDYYKGFGIAVDAVRIQRLAADYGVQLAVHGHKHRSFIWRSSVYELPEYTNDRYRLGELSIIGGGSAGSSDTDGSRNYFNLLDIAAWGLTLSIFKSENGGIFKKMKDCKGLFDFSAKQPKLSLSDWIV
ncbi:MAG: metallophosphoesterase [Acidobacteria bacterium]|nr:metallophosphoesterase [Acidobacteriota bacterium]